jgi:methylated-DNA-[protein]-cysteine S-methyltransferase
MNARHTRVETGLGTLTLTAAGDALTGVYYPHHWYPPTDEQLGEPADDDPLFAAAARQLAEYLTGRRTRFDLRTAAAGDAFQERVWAMIGEIPYGETTTYGEIAARLGDPALAQRVGQAVGRNPLSVVVPCHRVVGKDGGLTGYAGGLSRKKLLLDLESAGERLF